MKLNRSGKTSKEFFVSYLKLVMNTQKCSLEVAKEITFDRIFEGQPHCFGKEVYDNFLSAYEEMKESD
ncbi:hypothetical protein [Salinibacillus xinjiangensis]|uniref:Uncharacterized protein n=1 Tax=Salinibacillus xinjiangensis TaxID=1229268 RepID=A0A6G1X443_9BACI|nr:hypothetical protein [Salinibacillus xinjiangensis]MRG85763.1 hypothetical protein [Salinibacillus xinjiangensis]